MYNFPYFDVYKFSTTVYANDFIYICLKFNKDFLKVFLKMSARPAGTA